jgi:hypothetical protein
MVNHVTLVYRHPQAPSPSRHHSHSLELDLERRAGSGEQPRAPTQAASGPEPRPRAASGPEPPASTGATPGSHAHRPSSSTMVQVWPTSPCVTGQQGAAPPPPRTGSICLGSLLRLVVAAGLIRLDNAVAVMGIFLLLVDLGFVHAWHLMDHELVQRLPRQVLQLLQCRLPHQQVPQLLQR